MERPYTACYPELETSHEINELIRRDGEATYITDVYVGSIQNVYGMTIPLKKSSPTI